MQKSEIMEKLNIDEKLALIAEGKLPDSAVDSGVGVKHAGWKKVNNELGKLYPSPEVLANSWNSALIGQVSKDIAYQATKLGYNFLITVPLKVKSNPYTAGISEDPYFTLYYAYTMLKGMSESIVPCLKGCYMDSADIDYIDDIADARLLNDYFLAPCKAYTSLGGNCAVQIMYSKLAGSFCDVNYALFADAVKNAGGYLTSYKADSEFAVESVLKGNLFGTDYNVLRQAYGNYEYISKSIQTGEATQEELENALNDGSALGTDTVNGAVEKYFSLSELCNSQKSGADIDSYKLSVKAVEDSAVLLKNKNGALPLRKSEKVAVLGEWAFTPNSNGEKIASVLGECVTIVGGAPGYSLESERSDELLSKAMEVCASAETVVLFLGLSAKQAQKNSAMRKSKLPANQLALADAVARTGKKVIAIVSGDYYTDLGFDGAMSAVLIASLDCTGSARGIARVLSGLVNPSGRLANTYYGNTDLYFAKLRNDKNTGKLKVGVFTGYRRYDTEGSGEKYPFGYGLSYSQFTYTALACKDGFAEVTVKNNGRSAGSAVVQIYIGKNGSAVLRPAKELKSFTKVDLSAGEAKKVRFKINTAQLTVYDESSKTGVLEAGEYTLYAGSSLNDLTQSCVFVLAGGRLAPDGKKLSDYIISEANVLQDGYTLKPVKNVTAKGNLPIKWGAIMSTVIFLVIAGLFTLHLTGVVAIDDNIIVLAVLIVLIVGFLACLGVCIGGFAVRKKARKTSEFKATTENARREVQPRRPFEQLFEEVFAKEKKTEEVKTSAKQVPDDEIETLKYYDPSMNFKTASVQLQAFIRERGLEIDTVSVRKLLCAMGSSRLVILRGADNMALHKLISLVCEYFGSAYAGVDCTNSESLEQVIVSDERMKNLFTGAGEAKQKVHIAPFICPLEKVRKFITPLIRFIKSPNLNCEISAGGMKFSVPKNMWFIFTCEGGELRELDAFASDLGCVTEVSISAGSVSENKSAVRFLSYYQLNKMSADCVKTVLDEDKCWKKIDKLEKYVNGVSPYKINNKTCQRLEKYSSAYLLCGGEQTEALDCAVAEVVLPAMVSAVYSVGGLNFTADIEKIFGEDNIPECRKVMKNSGLKLSAEG